MCAVGRLIVVLKAEYRGTQVAVKRTLPAQAAQGQLESHERRASMSPTKRRNPVPLLCCSNQQMAEFLHEIRTISKVRHPCITTVLGRLSSIVCGLQYPHMLCRGRGFTITRTNDDYGVHGTREFV